MDARWGKSRLGNSEIMPGRGSKNNYLIRVLSPMMFRERIRGYSWWLNVSRRATGSPSKPADEKAIEMICDTPPGIINKLIVFLGIGLMGLMVNLAHAGNWWESDWEIHSPRWSEDNGSGSWGEFWTHSNNPRTPWHVGVVGGSHPRRAGAQSIRFERRTG